MVRIEITGIIPVVIFIHYVGDVTTLCDIERPLGIAITKKRMFIVSLRNNKLMVVAQSGISFLSVFPKCLS
jgi:hypothetical protein